MMRKFTSINLISAAFLLLAVGGAWSQHAGLNVTFESVRPTPLGANVQESFQASYNPIESILYSPDGEWSSKTGSVDLYKFNVEWGVAEGVTVKRNLNITRLDNLKGRPFSKGLREERSQVFNLSPFEGTTFEFTESSQETVDLASVSLGGSETEVMKFGQSFGGGATAGNVNYTRNVTRQLKPTEDAALAPLALTRTDISEQFSVGQGFGMLGQTGSLEWSRGLKTVQMPKQDDQVQTSDRLKVTAPLWAQTNFSGLYETSHADRFEGNHSNTREMSLARKFTSGDAKVAFSDQSVRNNTSVTETKSQEFVLPFRFDGTLFAISAKALTQEQNDKLMKEQRSVNVATQIAGNPLVANWSRDMQNKGGKDNKVTNVDFSLPVNFYGEKIAMSFNSAGTQIDGAVQKKSRAAKLAVPLSHFVQGSSFTYDVVGTQDVKKADTEVRVAKLIVPLNVLNTPVATQFQRITTHQASGKTMQFVADASMPLTVLDRKLDTSYQYAAIDNPNGSERNTLSTRVSIPTKPGAVVVQRQATTDVAADGTEKQTRVVNVAGPKVPLAPLAAIGATVQADMSYTDLPGGINHHSTHVALSSQPIDDMTVALDYSSQDLGRFKETKQRKVDWTYEASSRLALHWRYLEKEQLDRSPLIQRTMVVQHKNAKPTDPSVRAAFTSTANGADESDWMKVLEFGMGDPQKLGLNVRLQEYDEKKLNSLGDPTLSLGLQHGSTESLHVAMNYEDCKGRAEPQREYRVGLPVGDAALSLGFSQNTIDPTDPKKKAIRMADIYDATLQQQIFANVDMNLSYRYCDFDEVATTGEDIDQWWQMSLKGGRPADGGAIELAYACGDFVELNTKKPTLTPSSKMSLKYEKDWTESGKIRLQVDRTTMSEASNTDDTYEGSVQFDYRF